MSVSASVLSAVLMGLGMGMTPGPTSALVISQTLRFGLWEGAIVALAPALADLPIVFIAAFLLPGVASQPAVLAILAGAGALFLGKLAWEAISATEIPGALPADERPRSFTKGLITNWLNPAPYLFWGTVGLALLARQGSSGVSGIIVWWVLFYAGFATAKVGLAAGIKWGADRLPPSRLLWVQRALGLALVYFSAALAWDAFVRVGAIYG